MQKNLYQCNRCKKTFGRKWNALRHNKDVHQGFGVIFNSQSGAIIGINVPLNILDNQNADDYFNGSKNSKQDEEIDFEAILGKLIDHFEELERVCSNTKEPERTKGISEIFIMALMMPDPIKSLKKAIELLRSKQARIKILNYVARGTNTNLLIAENYLMDIIKENAYFIKNSKLNQNK